MVSLEFSKKKQRFRQAAAETVVPWHEDSKAHPQSWPPLINGLVDDARLQQLRAPTVTLANFIVDCSHKCLLCLHPSATIICISRICRLYFFKQRNQRHVDAGILAYASVRVRRVAHFGKGHMAKT